MRRIASDRRVAMPSKEAAWNIGTRGDVIVSTSDSVSVT